VRYKRPGKAMQFNAARNQAAGLISAGASNPWQRNRNRHTAYILIDCYSLRHWQPCVLATVNCADVALSVFYSVLTRCRIFLQLWIALSQETT